LEQVELNFRDLALQLLHLKDHNIVGHLDISSPKERTKAVSVVVGEVGEAEADLKEEAGVALVTNGAKEPNNLKNATHQLLNLHSLPCKTATKTSCKTA